MDIELVIKIPKESYKATCNGCMLPPDVENVVNAIKNGKILQNHEDLIDRMGKWIIVDDCEHFIAKCSECGRIEDSRMINKYPYCHCGAKMEVSE